MAIYHYWWLAAYMGLSAVSQGVMGVLIAAIGIVSGMLLSRPQKTYRQYIGGYEELDPVVLNMQCRTDWLNLGVWTRNGEESYSDACKSMAQMLGRAVKLSPTDTVLDTGFGRGEQCKFWFEEFGIRSLAGINISPEEVSAAKVKVSNYPAKLVVASATCFPPSIRSERYSKVVSLDSAYHYSPSREAFFREAFGVLEAGGSLGLADIVAVSDTRSWSPFSRLLLKFVCFASTLPMENLVTIDHYENQLRNIGFKEVSVQSIGSSVFPGFAAFVDSHRKRFPAVPLKYRVAAWLCSLVFERKILDYKIVVAKK
ncbi:hypothetical protein DIPPA_52146 [Diplonema papillatum]|nr:hypothetical protein DIPPA_52146 [Diplonema papillatum]